MFQGGSVLGKERQYTLVVTFFKHSNKLLISLLGHEILPDISLASCIALTIDSLKYSIQVNIPFMQLIVMCLFITGYI